MKGFGSEADNLTTVAFTLEMCKMVKEQKKQNNTNFYFTTSNGYAKVMKVHPKNKQNPFYWNF